MSAAFDVYQPGRSWLHRLDPRVKLTATALGSVVVVVEDDLGPLLLAIAALHAVLLGSGLPVGRLLGVWRAIAVLLALIVLLWPVFDRSGEPVWTEVGWLRVTGDAVWRGMAAAGRLAALSFLVFAWLATTSERAMIRAFVRLGLPHRWGVALAIGLRSIPGLAALYGAVGDAQQARGLRLDGSPRVRLRAHLPILVATLATALRLADQTARALDARGFGGPVRPTVLNDLRMRRGDWLAVAAVVLGGLVAARRWLGG